MTSPNSIAALMPPSRDSLVSLGDTTDDIDLSVLFNTSNHALPDFRLETNSVLEEMNKEREDMVTYVMEMISKMTEKIASLKAALKVKDEQIEKISEDHRQTEQALQLQLKAIQSELKSIENLNTLSAVYFKDFLKRLAGAVCDGEDYIKSIDYSMKKSTPEKATIIELNSDNSDDEGMPNETIEREVQTSHRPAVDIDRPGPSNVADDISINTDDESLCGEKENVAPEMDAPAIEPAQTGDNHKTAKAVKSVMCKWCRTIVPKKLLSEHKLEVHKIPINIKDTVKSERFSKRKNTAEEDFSDDEVSISSETRPSLVPLRIRGQAIVKPKKAKKMVTSSPA